MLLVSKKKIGVAMHFSETINLKFVRKCHTLLCILLLFKVLLAPKIFFPLNEISYKLQHFCENFFCSVKTSIIGALLKYEKSVEKDAILVHDRVIRGLGPVAL